CSWRWDMGRGVSIRLLRHAPSRAAVSECKRLAPPDNRDGGTLWRGRVRGSSDGGWRTSVQDCHATGGYTSTPESDAGPQIASPVPEPQNGSSLGVLRIWLVLFWTGLKFLVGRPPTLPALPSAWPS